jgi:hypothetical protein
LKKKAKRAPVATTTESAQPEGVPVLAKGTCDAVASGSAAEEPTVPKKARRAPQQRKLKQCSVDMLPFQSFDDGSITGFCDLSDLPVSQEDSEVCIHNVCCQWHTRLPR